jgi:hypothetical protein
MGMKIADRNVSMKFEVGRLRVLCCRVSALEK